jgi:hypothetical protein
VSGRRDWLGVRGSDKCHRNSWWHLADKGGRVGRGSWEESVKWVDGVVIMTCIMSKEEPGLGRDVLGSE